MSTVVHVTHEAIQKIGGIGAVLQGLLTSKVFLDHAPRNILVGPYWPNESHGDQRLGPAGEVLYSGMDGIFHTPLAGRLREIEHEFGVRLIYGRRRFTEKQGGVPSTAEVVLIDVSSFNEQKIGLFKFRLWQTFDIDSGRYQHVWDYEQYMRLAEPALAVLHAIGAASQNPADPAVILSHEYMGMPTVLAAILEGPGSNFRTVFHAHECATVRRIVEAAPGQDTMFYNVMKAAVAAGRSVDDTFGSQYDFYKHALIRATRFCDNIFAVGDYTLAEMRFLGNDFADAPAQLAYNGVPHWKLTLDEKNQSRQKLRDYCQTLLKFKPDHVFTHVTRLVPSKGLWRDLKVLEHVETLLRERNETAVLFTLSTEVPGRNIGDVRRMESEYHWPVVHREGGSDLSGGEAAFYAGVQEFNAQSRNIKVVFINQFGFDRTTCGDRMPAGMEFMDIRKGSDAEFGQSIYEPFGIAQVEPISFGGICVMTNVCGSAGLVDKITAGRGTPNVIIADYTKLPTPLPVEKLIEIGKAQRQVVEESEGRRVAKELVDRLPRTPAEVQEFIDRGHELAAHMSWDAVCQKYIVPGLKTAVRPDRVRKSA
jgi:hypothetical protein